MKIFYLLILISFILFVWSEEVTTITQEDDNESLLNEEESTSLEIEEATEITLIPGPVICEYKKKDLKDEYDADSDVVVHCEGESCDVDGEGVVTSPGFVNITSAGTFIIQGSLDGQVYIEATKDDYIHLILDDVSIFSDNGPAIYGVTADKITITVVGNNTLADSNNYTFVNDDDDEPDACLFIDSDLSINGSGSLTVTGNFKDAIRCKKDLRLIDATINVPSSVNKGIKAKNSLCIKDANIDVTSVDSAIKVTRDDDAEKGYIVIDSGNIKVSTEKDGIHAETHLTINDGYIDVQNSKEGIEGQMIDILGGEIHIFSSNDGINASKINNEEEDDEDESKNEPEPETNAKTETESKPKNESETIAKNETDSKTIAEPKTKTKIESKEAKTETETGFPDSIPTGIPDHNEKENDDQAIDRRPEGEGNFHGGPNDQGGKGGHDQSATGADGSVYINIVGGKVFVTISGNDCDGIDSNGVLYIGGEAEVYTSIEGGEIFGTMAALDAEGYNAINTNATVIVTAESKGNSGGKKQENENGNNDQKVIKEENGGKQEAEDNVDSIHKEKENTNEKDQQGNDGENPNSKDNSQPPNDDGKYPGQNDKENDRPQRPGDIGEPNSGEHNNGGHGGMNNETGSIYQPYITTTVSSQNSGTLITVKNSDDEVIASYTPTVKFSTLLITSPKIVANETYTIILGDGTTQTVIASEADSGSVNSPSVDSPTGIIENYNTTSTVGNSTATEASKDNNEKKSVKQIDIDDGNLVDTETEKQSNEEVKENLKEAIEKTNESKTGKEVTENAESVNIKNESIKTVLYSFYEEIIKFLKPFTI